MYVHTIPANGELASSDRETMSADSWTYIRILYVCGTNQNVSERDNIHTNVINDLQLTH